MLEQFSTILAVLSTIFGVVGSVGYFPQIWKMIKRKSSHDVSFKSYILFTPSCLFFLLYGISLNNIPLIIVDGISMVGAVLVMYFCIKYRKVKL